jgi:hypothetical protein
MRQLPGLVLGLQQAGLIKVDEGKRKPVESTGTDSVNMKMYVGNVTIADSSSELTSNDPSCSGNHILPAGLDKEEKREVAIISGDIAEDPKSPQESHPKDTESPNENAVIEEPVA